MSSSDKRAVLRRLIERGTLLVAPGVYDPLMAQVVARTGFEVAYLSGSGVASGLFGKPDVGLVTQTEMTAVAARVAEAVDLPVIADADDGYGNAINVLRTVREFERAGVAAIHLEDQVHPKRCGHLAGKEVIAAEEMVGKLHAALDAREDPNFLIIARTDARGPLGVEEAIRRGRLYRQAGADLVMFDAALSVEEILRYPEEVDAPLVLTLGGYGRERTTPKVPLETLQAAGYAVVIFPLALVRVAVHAVWQFCLELSRRGTEAETDFIRTIVGHPIEDWYDYVGVNAFRKLEDQYLPSEELLSRYQAQVGYPLTGSASTPE